MWEKLINISEETLKEMHSFSTNMHLCIQQGGGHLKNIVYKN